jgi:Protein of unknown function (DUF3768)
MDRPSRQLTQFQIDCVRILNDKFRRTLLGGWILLTDKITGLPSETVDAVKNAVKTFEYPEADEPRDQHDFGEVEVNGARYCFTIECRGLDLYPASNPADACQTMRFLSIMYSDEPWARKPS